MLAVLVWHTLELDYAHRYKGVVQMYLFQLVAKSVPIIWSAIIAAYTMTLYFKTNLFSIVNALLTPPSSISQEVAYSRYCDYC